MNSAWKGRNPKRHRGSTKTGNLKSKLTTEGTEETPCKKPFVLLSFLCELCGEDYPFVALQVLPKKKRVRSNEKHDEQNQFDQQNPITAFYGDNLMIRDSFRRFGCGMNRARHGAALKHCEAKGLDFFLYRMGAEKIKRMIRHRYDITLEIEGKSLDQVTREAMDVEYQ
jgi:hypothetical protein